jgi:hypothetical protein
MARSPLSLLAWFCLIRQLLIRPQTSTRELAILVGVRRLATVRRMADAVRRAADAPQSSDLLAGLDRFFGRAPLSPAAPPR